MISSMTLSLLAAVAPSTAIPEHHIEPQTGEVAILIRRAAKAHEHLMRGDIASYLQAIQVAPDFILMDPFGGDPTGAPKSRDHWDRIGRFFREGRDAIFKPIASYQAGNLVVLVANETANVSVGALPAQDWSLRVTLVFRCDDGTWRLVHRHADPLARGISLEEAGRITLRQAAASIGRGQ